MNLQKGQIHYKNTNVFSVCLSVKNQPKILGLAQGLSLLPCTLWHFGGLNTVFIQAILS